MDKPLSYYALLDPGLFRPSVHLMVEIAFRDGENAVFLLDPVEHPQVVPHFVTEKIGHLDSTIAFLGFRGGNHIRVSPEENEQLEIAVRLSGLTKQDYITRRLLNRDIVVQGNPRVYKLFLVFGVVITSSPWSR
mgnify:CR=1 FL=1